VDDSLPELPLFEMINNDRLIYFPARLGEPQTIQVDKICADLQTKNKKLPTAIIGIGGGSTMDVAKAVSLMLTNVGESADYQGWDLVNIPGIFKVGVPTISGSGAESSRTAVLMGKEKKFGINSDFSMFDSILLDSMLTHSIQDEQRFFTGMDCFIHCVESLQGTMTNDLSKAYASKALELFRKSYLEDYDADEMMVASYLGGASIVNSEVGICHALSYGLSLELGFRHGIANCIVFNALDGYYGKHVKEFRRMVDKFEITLPKNVCWDLSENTLNRMVDMTIKMDKPLTNALGKDWRENLIIEKIKNLYLAM
jgi:3-deoxy-alpha-D-manno-octulosonate 8-oxidase